MKRHLKQLKIHCIPLLIVILFMAVLACNSAGSGEVVELATSPYVHIRTPEKLYTIDDQFLTEGQKLTVASLQGIMTKGESGIFRITGDPSKVWLDILEQDHGIKVDRSTEQSFAKLITVFAPKLDGYILCNTYDQKTPYKSDESLSVALTLAGPFKSIVVTEETKDTVETVGIELRYDARDKRLEPVLDEYSNLLNSRQLIYRPFHTARTFLTDYGVAGNMIHYYGSLKSSTAKRIFDFLDPNSTLLGWGDSEDGLVKVASDNSVMVYPADWANNISVLSGVPTKSVQKDSIQEQPRNENVHTATFVMSDGDNIQWALNTYAFDERWFNSEYRGKFDLGWTTSPSLVELAPTVLNYFYQQAESTEEGRDYFIAGPSGLGYIFPERFPAIQSNTELLNGYMERADLSIVNILAKSKRQNGYLENYLAQESIDAIFLYYYSNYSGGRGKIWWVDDKPVITGRARLWEGFNSPEKLAEKLNKLSTDPSSEDGYSLIPVHVWSMSVQDVYRCVSLLNENVQVVAPDEFVQLIMERVER